MPRTVTAIFVVACSFCLGAPCSHNLPVAGFAAKQAASETGSAAPPAKIAVKEWDVPTPDSHPHDPAVAPDGALWYSGQMSNTLGRLDPKTGKIQEFRLKTPDSGPHGLVAARYLAKIDAALLVSLRLPWHEKQITTRQIPICRQCRVACVSSIAQTS
jgi:streptogramin lyase